MKKSTKILVPALAVLALGMAASVTGTVAWFNTSAANHTENTASQGFTVISNDLELGGIQFTAVKGTVVIPEGGLELSDDNGVTYYTNGGSNYVKPNVTFSDTYVVIPISVTVSDVAGGDTFANKIATLAGNKIVLDITGAFATHDAANPALKYKYSAAPAKSTGGWATESVTGIKQYTITGSETNPTTIIAEFNLYVGINGAHAQATEQIASENVTITITPRWVAA